MKFHRSTMYTLLTIAAIASTQSTALAQAEFKVPTHPNAAEVEGLHQRPTASVSSMTSECHQVPTHPILSEISGCQSKAGVMMAAVDQAPSTISQVLMGKSQNFFSHPPTLTRAHASQNAPYTPSTYEFTLSVPADAGAPLKAVTISQDTNLETVRFNPNQSKAFAGKRYAAGPEIPLVQMGGPETPGVATIVFEEPVQPGSTVTIALDSRMNPQWGGVYEFGVTAYPTSEAGRGQFLGYGRINFYGSGD